MLRKNKKNTIFFNEFRSDLTFLYLAEPIFHQLKHKKAMSDYFFSLAYARHTFNTLQLIDTHLIASLLGALITLLATGIKRRKKAGA